MSAINEEVSELTEEIRVLLLDANLDNNTIAIENGVKKCSKALRIINKFIKKSDADKTMGVGCKQHLIACSARVKGFRKMLQALQIVGSGYRPRRNDKARKITASNRVKWEDLQSSFESRMRTGVIINLTHKDVAAFLDDALVLFQRRIKNMLKMHEMYKVNTVFCSEFMVVKGNEEIFEFKYMNTKNYPIYRDTNIADWFTENVKQSILTQLEEFQEKDSGWALSTIINLMININKYTPMLGSSYIDLPRPIKLKKACINLKNDDNACFAWSVVSAIYTPQSHLDRVSSYPHYTTILNLENITMPMTTKQIPRFEKQNNISINVYILEKKRENFKTMPTYLTKEKKQQHVNLLVLQDKYVEEGGEDINDMSIPRYHYVWIKNLSRLVSSQLNKHDGMKYICDRCLHYFHIQSQLDAHTPECVKMNDCKIRLPVEGRNIVEFKNHKYKETAPFIIYADIECLLQPKTAKLNEYQDHVPYSIGYYVKCAYDDSLSFYKSYRGEDCQKWFSNELKQFAEDVETVFLCPRPMNVLTSEENEYFYNAKSCHICEKVFTPDDKRVRDHCHLTGEYRGPAHENCNLEYQDSHIIPIVFHNLSGYDAHFIIENIASDFDGRVDLLPINKEKYISFTKHVDDNIVKFRFIDSYRFMAGSLDKLGSYLTKFPILRSEFPNLDDSKFKLLNRKGIFPYDFVDSWQKLDSEELPNMTQFYNKLNDSHISESDYEHAKVVWNTFNCKDLGAYSDLYLKTDILLLSDVFEQFRSSCQKTYGLDPAHYYTLPGYTWDCMLKHTNINLELLTNIDMIMFIERGIRGGLSQCTKRHAKANNMYMDNYNPDDPNIFLMYNDINNQYGWAMSQSLPYGAFEWVKDIENFNLNLPDDNFHGYFLEVDLEYPESIHDAHADLPFCPEHLTSPNCKETKLLATLHNKERYVIHYRNLKQCIDNGLILTKIHRVLKFKQSSWLKSYIDLNTKLRTAAINDFERNLFKLMNNAVFGKTMENIRKHSIVKLVTKWEGRYGAEALISKPNFKASTIFNKNLVAIELNKSEIYFNKAIYIGAAILDLAKLTTYSFHYDFMKNKYGDAVKLCYTDTDSLIYEVKTANIYHDIKANINMFDTSDYPQPNIFGIPSANKKVLGLMKDENSGLIMIEFVGLRSKMYASRVEGADEMKKAKGVKMNVIKNQINFNDYLYCLENSSEKIASQNLIRSSKHKVSSVMQQKIALSPFDSKRFICKDGVNTLPWGHYSILEE